MDHKPCPTSDQGTVSRPRLRGCAFTVAYVDGPKHQEHSELAAPTAARIRGRFLRRIRNFTANTYMSCMNKILSPEQTARLERQRLAAEDGAKALQEVAERSVAVRENMARLRA